MWRQFGIVVLGEWLAVSPMIWEQASASSTLAVIGGGVAVGLALGSPFYPGALNWAALVGFILLLSALILHEGAPFNYGNRGTVGALILLCAVAPSVRLLHPGEKPH